MTFFSGDPRPISISEQRVDRPAIPSFAILFLAILLVRFNVEKFKKIIDMFIFVFYRPFCYDDFNKA